MSDRPSFLQELKRRKVVRAAVVYAAVSWAVLQVADIVLPALGLPEKMMTGLVVLLGLGFPLALGLAWAFDLTGEGVKRAERSPDAEDAPSHGWVSLRTVVVAVVLVGAGWLGGRVTHPARADRADGPPSVAVLPFRELGAADETHFADGVQDDILTQLARIKALRVTSRTSTERYRGTDKDIPDIARELNVRAVLEGGVQRTPDRVHINVQLIDGATDEHLWAETYDRELTADNIFGIQSEIARAVAEALKATLSPEDEKALAEVPTRDLEALDLYHRARRMFDESDDLASQIASIAVFQEAVKRDPGFVRAWAELTRALSWPLRGGNSGDTLPARDALEHVQALAPGSVDATLAEGNYLYYARGDFAGALAAFQRLDPAHSNDPDVAYYTANVLRRLGDWQGATDLFQRSLDLDPENPRAISEVGWMLAVQRRFDEAEVIYRRWSAAAPDNAEPILRQMDVALWGRGDTAQAHALLSRLVGLEDHDGGRVVRADLAYLGRDPNAPQLGDGIRTADQTFTAYTIHPGGPTALWQARMAWGLGDTTRARELAEGIVPDILADSPVLAQGGPPVPPGEDLFSIKAGLHVGRAWTAAFRGQRALALAEADSAVVLCGPDDDATDGTAMLRQRVGVRVAAGDLDGAMEDLRTLLAIPGFTTVWELRMDPFYDPLRERSDFQALIAGS